MACASPYTVYHPDGLIDRVRCGRCTYCRIRRKQQWVGRLTLEAAAHVSKAFLTLTYEDDPGVLQVRDLQLFLKRFRVQFGQVRYFAVGEYGEENGRGHWHLITFGPALPTGGDTLSRVWTAGFSLVGTIDRGALGYVAGYALKAPRPDRPRIARMSLRPGLGFPQIEAIASDVARQGGVSQWPSSYRVGKSWFPLTDGGIRHFQRCYLNAGGQPPATLTPKERDMVARFAMSDWGLRIQEMRLRKSSELAQGSDRHAIQAPQRGSLR